MVPSPLSRAFHGWLANMILRAVLLWDHRQLPSTDWWHLGLHSNPITGSQPSGFLWSWSLLRLCSVPPAACAHLHSLCSCLVPSPVWTGSLWQGWGRGILLLCWHQEALLARPGTVLSPRACKGQEGLVGEVGLRAGAAVTGQHLLLQCAS